MDGRSRLPTPEAPPPVVRFSVRPPHTTAGTTSTSDSSDSEYSSNSTASGTSQDPPSQRGPTDSRMGPRAQGVRRGGSRHRQPDPPAYTISSSVSPQGCESGSHTGAPQRNRDSRDHWQAPPPARPRTDAFETATEAGGHREHLSGPGAHSSHHLHHQPITTVTASASVTVAVHPAPSTTSSYPAYTDTYREPQHTFHDPHVPLDSHSAARAKVEVMELQDLEFELGEQSSSRRAS